MKKLLIILSSVALLTGTAIAQQGSSAGNGSGSGTADGSGPNGPGPGIHADMDLSTIEGIPEDVLAAHEANAAEREALRAERQAVLDGLGAGATDDEIRAELEQWREANSVRIDAIRENAQLVREWFRAQRPDRPQLGDSDNMKRRRAQFREDVQSMRQSEHRLRLKLQDPDLSAEEREELVQAFRDENREVMQRLRARKRQQRLDQGSGGGDRRQGPEG